ncbi:hypothetical protein DPM19_00245 [Actinomadura craniellae]|uniref:Uncharacterized protein n=1 Tax=Actinomadura craniellae TaxID=2231787 RepID=A0A365HC22_9ACTN|nr:hypothetical protein DPM19_00245 [Actinomadura craniellae]
MLCLTCRRVRPARDPHDYTPARARLITRHGLCICIFRELFTPPRLSNPIPSQQWQGAPQRE